MKRILSYVLMLTMLSSIGVMCSANAITDLTSKWYIKPMLSMCRQDVQNALTDEAFTNQLLQVKNDKKAIKDLFDRRGVRVTDSEVDYCYNIAKKYL